MNEQAPALYYIAYLGNWYNLAAELTNCVTGRG